MLCPLNLSGFEMTMVDKIIQGGINFISIGYRSQYPWKPDAGVKNFKAEIKIKGKL